MMFKKIFLFICLFICLFSMASVCAGEVNDTAITSTDIIELSQGEKILTDNLKSTDVISPLEQTSNGGIILQTTDNGTFRDLQIKINATEEGGTVNLMNNYTYNESDNEISITKAITINGNGFTINALGNSRIFNIEASGNIVLNNITFINGKSDLGGAILFNNTVSDIIIDNCKFINNSATKNGGALYFNDKFINSTIRNTEFISNVASKNGGAVYIFNSSTENLFENLIFSNNRAQNNDGGSINFHWELLKTRFNNVTFFKNIAGSGGGAINTDQNVNDDNTYVNVNFINNTASKGGAMNGYGQSNYNSFDGCLFANNSATNNGGALYYKGIMQYNVFENSLFIKNTANTGNGGVIYANLAFNYNRFNNDSFINNSAAVNGGSLYVYDKFNTNSIENTKFISNVATNNGGAVYIRGISTENRFENLTFSNNMAKTKDGGSINFYGETSKSWFNNVTFFKNSAGGSGGAINNDNNVNNDNAYVNVNFINNTASKGGAMNGYGRSNRNSFEGCQFANNSAANDGGAIYYKGNILSNVFENCSFSDNTASAGNGGVIFTFRDSISNNFNKCLFVNNSAAVNGGALYVNATFTNNVIGNTEFISNVASKNGGAVYIFNSSTENLFENLTFSNNEAKNNDGGSINFHWELLKTRFINVTFFKNSAGSGGGAINTDQNVNNENTYVNVNFVNNTANNGGALNGYGQSNYNSFDGCLFANNSATNNGGAIYYRGNIVSNVFDNCSFIKNTANNNGGVMFCYKESVSNNFNKDLFINNSAKNNAGAIYYRGSSVSNTFNDTEFRGNSARGMDGGAISVFSNLDKATFNNVTFINNTAANNGGAINVDDDAKNNIFINVMFINNTASKNGGAISFVDAVNNVLNNTIFIQNKANVCGGAIYTFNKMGSDSIINSLFINNAAGTGGVINFKIIDVPITIMGIFINNTGDSVININESNQNSTISDSIFLNNNAANVQVNSGSIQLINNWFGNNATNYNETPNVGSVDIDNWLFLNATANPIEVEIYKNSKITFKLYSYNGSAVIPYDASKMNIKLDLTKTLGELDKNVSSIGEDVLYTANEYGNSSVTAKFETALYTISLTNVGPKMPTVINVTNSTVDLQVNDEIDTGATLTPADAGNLTYTSSNSSVAIVENGKIRAIGGGQTIITVSFAGNGIYAPAENKTITVTVSKLVPEITVSDIEGAVGETVNATVTIAGGDAEGTVIFDNVSYTVSGGQAIIPVTLVSTNMTNITVSYSGDGKYLPGNVTKDIVVYKPNATIDITVPSEIPFGVNATVEVSLPADAKGNVTLIVDGIDIESVPVVEGSANFTIPALNAGNHIIEVAYSGDDKYNSSSKSSNLKVIGVDTVIRITEVTGNCIITGVLSDIGGNGIANAELTVFIKDNVTTVKTDDNGTFTIQAENAVVTIEYVGSDVLAPSNATVTLNDIAPVRGASVISANDYTTYAIDYNAGERGGYFKVQLLDEKGIPLANKPVQIGFNGKVYNTVTNESGWAQLQINLAGAGTYTFAVAFLGDDEYNASFVVQKIIVNKKKTTISASAKSYKASAKTKSYTVTLKTDKGSSIDGKTYLASGKKITMTLNGKTYTAKTNSKGQATFKLSITKKGTFSTTIKFDGDKTYAASSKSVKITIK